MSGCPNNWCYFGSCTVVSNRASRTVTFVNNCQQSFAVYRDAAEIISKANFPVGATRSYQVSLSAGTNGWGLTYYKSGTGINFRAFPDDQDLSNSTLFEVNFGAYEGLSDVYDLSAIPPSSCAGHMQSTDNDYGYADHLPYKDPNNASQNWGCLKNPQTGLPDPGTCGDGLGYRLCPAVAASTGVAATVKPPTAQQGVNYGCGVPGEKCCGATSTPCCPSVCAVTGTDNPTDPAVRNKVHNCAYRQSAAVATNLGLKTKIGTTPRQTGFWKGMKVELVWPVGQSSGSGCRNIVCKAGGTESAPDISNMAATCTDGYLWPYDDNVATVTCQAAPDYKITFCPSS
jgi:hypothetical protein